MGEFAKEKPARRTTFGDEGGREGGRRGSWGERGT